jgi:hypothetical protein
MAKLGTKLWGWARSLVWQLPDKPYPSGHPWHHRHDPSRPRG